jgi:hypothetical protein
MWVRNDNRAQPHDLLTFICNVGSTESGTPNSQLLLDDIRKDVDVVSVDVNTLLITHQVCQRSAGRQETENGQTHLDEADSLGIFANLALELLDDLSEN